MNFERQLAKYVIGIISTSQLPELALKGLEEGFQSDSLIILAGLSKNENSCIINQYFEMALFELKITLPEKRKASLILIEEIIEEINGGEKDIIQATGEIINTLMLTFDLEFETTKYCVDKIGFASIYGLYYTYDDIMESDHSWYKDRSNESLMTRPPTPRRHSPPAAR